MPPLVIALVLISAVMHAGWNLLVRRKRATDVFLRISLVITVFGLLPALALEFLSTPILPIIWTIVPAAAVCQAIYYLGLSRAYRSGEFTVVYPLARALPVLLVALTDLLRGHPPAPLGWLGLVLVFAGCILIPLESLRGFSLARYWNRTSLWIIVAALGTVGYTTFDSIAGQAMQAGPDAAIRYGIFEFSLAFVAFSLIMKSLRQPIQHEEGLKGWRTPLIAGVFLFTSYALILWSLQLTPHASYVVALRQLSIVIGVVVGAVAFRETAPGLRISAAAITVAGVVVTSLAP